MAKAQNVARAVKKVGDRDFEFAVARHQIEKCAARILDLVQSLLDPLDRMLGELEREARAGAGTELRDRIEGIVDALRPVPRLLVVNVSRGPRRPVDRRLKSGLQGLVVRAVGGGGQVQSVEQAGSASARPTTCSTSASTLFALRWSRMRASAPRPSGSSSPTALAASAVATGRLPIKRSIATGLPPKLQFKNSFRSASIPERRSIWYFVRTLDPKTCSDGTP